MDWGGGLSILSERKGIGLREVTWLGQDTITSFVKVHSPARKPRKKVKSTITPFKPKRKETQL